MVFCILYVNVLVFLSGNNDAYCYCVIVNRFVGRLSRIDAENMLKDLQDGVFLIRESDQRKGEYAVGLR